MCMSVRRSLIGCLATSAVALAFSASAEAVSSPITIGANTSGLPSQPAVAVDSTGTAYIVWDDQIATGSQPADTVLNFCKVSKAAPHCAPVELQVPDPSHAQFFDPPSVLVSGATVRVFEDVDGAGNQHEDGIDEWVSTDGGSTFIQFPYSLSNTQVGDTEGTGPMPLIPLFGDNVGFGQVSAIQNPLFEANSLTAPQEYSAATTPMPPSASLNPSPNDYVVGNLGGEFASQLTGTTGILGVFELIETGPCPSGQGLVYAYAPLSAATTNSELNTTTGQPGSPWAPLGEVTCNAESPAVTSGPDGLGVLATNDASLSAEKVQFRRFTAPSAWGAPVTVADDAGLEPTVSQDGAGGMYATFVNNDHGLQLAYSSDGGSKWSGPVTLFGIKNDAAPGSAASAVSSTGQGWAVYAFQGTEYAQPFVAADALPPEVSHLKLKPASFKGLSSGGSIVKKAIRHKTSTVSYSDTQAAKTTFKVIQLEHGYKLGHGACKALPPHGHAPAHAHHCTRDVSKGSFSHQDSAGPNSFDFSGRVRGHRLSPGSYEVEAAPKLGALTGKTVSAKFEID
jgi:hypothetical protein